MYTHHIDTLRKSIAIGLRNQGIEKLTAPLFNALFERFPETQNAFDAKSLESFAPQKFKLVSELIIDTFAHPAYAEISIINEIVRHQMYDLKDKEYYFTLAESVEFCVKKACADDWDEDMQECWQDAITAFRGLVINAIREADL